MRGHGLRGLALVVGGLAGGCAAGGMPSALPVADARPAVETSAETRSRAQKPDASAAAERPPRSLLTVEPITPVGGIERSHAAVILAVVNGEAILDEEVRAAAYQALAHARTKAEQEEAIHDALTQLIDREVVLQEAFARLAPRGAPTKFLDQLKSAAHKEFDRQWMRRMMKGNNIHNETDLRHFLADHNMSLHLIRRQWERNFMAMEFMRNRIDPSLRRIGHNEIAEYYDKHPEEFQQPDAVEWQDLFIPTQEHPSREAARQLAASLAERVRKGEDFVRLSRSFDRGDAGLRDAAGLGTKHGEIRPAEAEALLFKMRDGELGLIEIPSGFHVIRLVKRQHAGPVPFDDKVQKQIHDRLRGEVFQREMKRIVTDLKRSAVIEIAN